MKAVILSGGRGTRLSPLTDKKPKPLVKIGGRHIMEILIDNLSRQGISECAVTLGYRGDDIRRALGDTCNGVKITYFEEKEPLGTAGAVKNCESFLDTDFIVVSGDALCDIDLEKLSSAHRLSGDYATIALTPSAEVLEYGVVLTDHRGRVTGFSEKPSWEGVRSDLVNCGIYLFKREILDLIPKGRFWDFSGNLFPEMLSRGLAINTCITRRFWCDVGNPWAFYNCNMKTLSRDFFVRYTPENIKVSPSAQVVNSVVGKNSIIKEECDVRRSVIGEGCVIGEGSELVGCILGDRVIIGKGVRVERGAVIGDDSVISDNRLVTEGKRFSADTRLEAELDGYSFTSSCTVTSEGTVNMEISSPEDFFSFGRSLSSLGDRIGFFHSSDTASYLSATVASLGFACSGGEGVIFGEGDSHDAVFASGALCLPCVCFEVCNDKIRVTVSDSDSLPLTRKRERQLSAAFERPMSARCDGEIKYFDGIEMLEKQYINMIFDKPVKAHGSVRIKNNPDGMRLEELSPRDTLICAENPCGEFFIEVSRKRQRISLSFGGKRLDTEHVQALIIKYLISRGRKRFVLHYGSPVAFDSIAKASGCEILRFSKDRESTDASELAFADLWARDVFFAAAMLYKVIESYGFSVERLASAVDSLPVFLCIRRDVDTHGVPVGEVMRRLEKNGDVSLSYDTLSIRGVRVVPDSKTRLKIFAEAQNTETALELCSFTEKLIESAQNSDNKV